MIFRALTGALLMALASMAGAAQWPTGYWLCRSAQGETSAQDRPCDATAQTVSAPSQSPGQSPATVLTRSTPGYWVCRSAQGVTGAQDRPCDPTAQTLSAPAPAAEPAPAPATAPAPVSAPAVGQARPTLPAAPPGPAANVKVRPNPFAPLIEMVWSMSAVIIALLVVVTAARILIGGKRRKGRSRRTPREERPLSAPADTHASAAAPTQWSAQLLQALEWKRFEELCEGFWTAKGHAARGTGPGADGGVDVIISDSRDPEKPFAVVQCKAWSKPVGCEPVRALWGTREHLGAPLAIFYSVAGFTPDARAFAEGKHLKLVSGHELLTQLETLPPEASTALLQHVTRGDYTTPSCPTCEIKMTRRPGRRGQGDFWACRNFRVCRTRPIPVRVDV